MKYIKKFENYELDDYVVVNTTALKDVYDNVPEKWLPFDLPVGKIIDNGAIKYHTGFISHVHKILRKATVEEIYEYNLMIASKKYNL